MLFYCWASVADAAPTFKQHWVNVHLIWRPCLSACVRVSPIHASLYYGLRLSCGRQCWLIVGPTTQMVAKHWIDVEPISFVCPILSWAHFSPDVHPILSRCWADVCDLQPNFKPTSVQHSLSTGLIGRIHTWIYFGGKLHKFRKIDFSHWNNNYIVLVESA